MEFEGKVIKYGDNVDTDVIIPARYLNTIDKKELASHCMEDLDKTFINRVQDGDIMVAGFNFGCGSSRARAYSNKGERYFSCYRQKLCAYFLQKLHKYRSADTGVPRGG